MDINTDLLQWLINFSIKKSSGGAVKIDIVPNQQLAEELQKPIITKFEQRKLYSSFKDNIWSTDLADMQIISKFN